MSNRFVHLHTHSEFSLVDSTIRLPGRPDDGLPRDGTPANLVSRCVELGQPAVALTDASNLFGLVKFYRAAEAAGVQPIAGCDLQLAPRREHEPPTRVTVLCQNQEGYRSLCRLLSRGWMQAPRVDHLPVLPAAWLQEHNQGLIVLLGARSELAAPLAAGDERASRQLLEPWLASFDQDRLYLELTRCRRPADAAFEPGALWLARSAGLPVMASNDVRFLERDDFDAHEARVCIAGGRVLDDPRRPRDYSAEQYLKSAQEMADLFADCRGAGQHRRAGAALHAGAEPGKYVLPEFPVPENESLDSWIRKEAHQGLERRLQAQPWRPATAWTITAGALDREVDVIVEMGFPGYF